ncbi:MAG: isocitrate dehydrogenase [Chloroflexi bacterium]|nr:isocitrate dehydrogenase [Chloroflexota bacterium]
MEQNRTIVVLQGDQTGQELLDEALRVLQPFVDSLSINFTTFDLSLENRRQTKNHVVLEAAEAIKQCGLGLKAATITPDDPDDVGSPNAILREAVDAQVILRVGRRIPPVRPVAGVHAPIAVVRMAVGGAYGAQEWREGDGLNEIAYRTERIERRVCQAVAEYAFQYAARTGAKVFGGPKFTVSPLYEGMFKEELDAAAERYPSVRYDPQLIDATYAFLLETTGEALVIPALNRDGDALSDLVLKMFGTIAGSESVILSLDDNLKTRAAIAEATHGTAPSLAGKNLANPMAMILAGAALLCYLEDKEVQRVCRAIRESTLETVYDGIRTSDLGGEATTSEFTDEVIRRTQAKLAVWDALG